MEAVEACCSHYLLKRFSNSHWILASEIAIYSNASCYSWNTVVRYMQLVSRNEVQIFSLHVCNLFAGFLPVYKTMGIIVLLC